MTTGARLLIGRTGAKTGGGASWGFVWRRRLGYVYITTRQSSYKAKQTTEGKRRQPLRND